MRITEDGASAALSPTHQAARLMDGYLITQLLYAAVKMGVTEALTDGPRDARAVAEAVGDAYVLSRVIHDWIDSSFQILGNCRAAMGDRATLLLVEAILPELAKEQPAAIRMDLRMLALLHGRERTVAEYQRLLGSAGFRLVRVVPTRSPAGVSVVEAAPA